MTDKKPSKPVTFEDYIPSEPTPKPRPKSGRWDLSKQDRERLDELDRSANDEAKNSDVKPKKKSNVKTIIFYIILLIIILKIID
ncbi:hypothetical protein GCM10009069_18370 [Algimonas arctica]|uniref:Uncharacterized protein n=1 Tax=Algimonas arctica TaxID=1479486 RepID=A0A8J3CSG1_9PROT|nr:hypothetical protein [Algimonas arctica]GHA95662.1 hypothetical protein GCM10009069_18370 [Algimonas arctica]